VNNAASGYVKALQHAMMGGRYQSVDLVEMNYAAIARAMGCGGIRVEDPETLSGALRRGMEERDRPTVIDVVVTRDPAQMLPAVDNRTVEIKQGDGVAGGAGSALEPLRAGRVFGERVIDRKAVGPSHWRLLGRRVCNGRAPRKLLGEGRLTAPKRERSHRTNRAARRPPPFHPPPNSRPHPHFT